MDKKTVEKLLEEKVAEELTPIDCESEYEEMLRESYGDVDVCGMSMDAADLLKRVDPTAFRCGMNDFYGSTDDYTEIDGELYRTNEVEKLREQIEGELADKEPEVE